MTNETPLYNRYLAKYEHMTLEEIEVSKENTLHNFEEVLEKLKMSKQKSEEPELYEKLRNIGIEIDAINMFYIIKLKERIHEINTWALDAARKFKQELHDAPHYLSSHNGVLMQSNGEETGRYELAMDLCKFLGIEDHVKE